MFYVYQHITADTETPFYVGKGSKDRAFSKASRNKFWKNIANKHGYKVQYISKNLNEAEAFYLENFYIKLYGRRDHGGILVNQTDGGDGQSGAVITEERKKYMSEKFTGRILKLVDAEAITNDYKKLLNLRAVANKYGICIATAMKYIPKEIRQLSRTQNGKLNAIRLLGKKPWNYGLNNHKKS